VVQIFQQLNPQVVVMERVVIIVADLVVLAAAEVRSHLEVTLLAAMVLQVKDILVESEE